MGSRPNSTQAAMLATGDACGALGVVRALVWVREGEGEAAEGETLVVDAGAVLVGSWMF